MHIFLLLHLKVSLEDQCSLFKLNCQKIPKLIKSLLGGPLICYVANGNHGNIIGNHIKHRFHHHKVDLDSVSLRSYCTDFLVFLYVNKSYFTG